MRLLHTICLAALLTSGLVPPSSGGEPAPGKGLVYVIPIEGMIEPALLYVIRRGVQEAEATEAQAIIFVMNTPGGTLQAAGDIVRTIQKLSVPTYTFVEKDAFSAGAIIAMATKHIYMAPGSVIGDAMPIMMTPMGGVEEMPEAMQEKMVSGVAALIRSAAQDSGHDPLLAEKMVRREIEYKIGKEVISPTGQLLTLTNVEAEREVGKGKDKRRLLSSGTVTNLAGLLGVIGRGGDEVRELKVTSIEKIARYIAALAPLFLIGGLLGIYIEIKTPGFGLPGILGILCLVIFFWGHHIAGLAGMEDLIVFILGLSLLIVEVFFFPGFGFLGIAGLLLMLAAMLSAMVERYPGTPWYPAWPDLQFPLFKLALSLALTAAAAVFLGKFLPDTPLFNRLILRQSASGKEGFRSPAPAGALPGLTGLAVTPLRPAGTMLLGNQRLDVITQGGYVEAGTAVRIVERHGNRIIVEAAPDGTATEKT